MKLDSTTLLGGVHLGLRLQAPTHESRLGQISANSNTLYVRDSQDWVPVVSFGDRYADTMIALQPSVYVVGPKDDSSPLLENLGTRASSVRTFSRMVQVPQSQTLTAEATRIALRSSFLMNANHLVAVDGFPSALTNVSFCAIVEPTSPDFGYVSGSMVADNGAIFQAGYIEVGVTRDSINSTHFKIRIMRSGVSVLHMGPADTPFGTTLHFVVVKQGSTLFVYINGELYWSGSAYDAGAVKFGAAQFGNHFYCMRGLMSDIAVFDRALSQAEARLLFASA